MKKRAANLDSCCSRILTPTQLVNSQLINSFGYFCINSQALQLSATPSTSRGMEKPTFKLSSSAHSKSSSFLPVETGRWSSQFTIEPEEGTKRRSFLSAVFTHSRSRSADGRDLAPPSYDTVTAPKRSKSAAKYNSPKCEVASLSIMSIANDLLRAQEAHAERNSRRCIGDP